MSAPKFTPGPLLAREGDTLNPSRTWGIVRLLSREACVEIDGDDSLYGERTEVVAEVCAASDGIDERDARMLAAAPELYAALQACEAWMVEHGVDRQHEAFIPPCLAQARSALGKAGGA